MKSPNLSFKASVDFLDYWIVALSPSFIKITKIIPFRAFCFYKMAFMKVTESLYIIGIMVMNIVVYQIVHKHYYCIYSIYHNSISVLSSTCLKSDVLASLVHLSF